ncbi:MAG TPA: hypothetical protein GXX22_04475 [Clostridiales bacterium]|nr:hypothetical protein [Clostridiales bacterium]
MNNHLKTAKTNGVIGLGDGKTAATRKVKRSQQQEELIVTRLMGLFIAATLLIVGLLLIKKNETIAFMTRFNAILPYIWIALGLLTAAAAGYYIWLRVKRVDDSKKPFSSAILLGSAAYLFVMSLLFRTFSISTHIIFVIATTAFCFIYAFYPRWFFFFSLAAAVGGMGIYCAKYGFAIPLSVKGAIFVLLRIASFALPFAAAALFFMARKGARKVPGGRQFPVLGSGYDSPSVIIGAALLLALNIFVIVFPQLVFYSLVVYFGAYLISAIVCTVKMI